MDENVYRTDAAAWERLWRTLGARGSGAFAHEHLLAAYGEAHRRYHDREHLGECLCAFDDVAPRLAQPAAVEAALWFHDAVYEPRSSTNEADSARLARMHLGAAGVSENLIRRVEELILATRHTAPVDAIADPDAATLVDIDLSILGRPAERFARYEAGIRAEYLHVPAPVFAEKRAEILAGFLARPRIFTTPEFFTRFEAAARENLRAAIGRLRTEGDT